jgi:hypothetical protein
MVYAFLRAYSKISSIYTVIRHKVAVSTMQWRQVLKFYRVDSRYDSITNKIDCKVEAACAINLRTACNCVVVSDATETLYPAVYSGLIMSETPQMLHFLAFYDPPL